MIHTTHKIANQILNLMDSRINEMMEKIVSDMVEEHAKRNQQFKPTARDFMIVKYGLVIDLLKSVEKYTLSTDMVTKLHDYVSPKGFTISATIERDGQEYKYSTDVIIAGGYNIQCLHYRYITNTNLPRINTSFDMVNEMKAGLKKVKAEKRIEDEIQYKKNAIERDEEAIAKLRRITKEDIILKDAYYTKKYEDLPQGHSWESEKEFLDWQMEILQNAFDSHQRSIRWRMESIKSFHKYCN